MLPLVLYSKTECHLCHIAKQQLRDYGVTDFTIIDITSDAELLVKYAIRIPVLERSDNHQELAWPFTLPELDIFLKAT